MILTTGELIARCEECVRTYDPARTTIDSHVDEFCRASRISDPDDERFVQQVTYGTFKYKKMLKIFLSSLYFKHGGETQRSDYTLYMVFGYIALLRLHELGFQDFRELVLSQEHFKMSVLLKFLFSETNLNEWLRPEWIKLYDTKFVDEQLIEKVLVFVPNVDGLMKVLEGRMASEAAKKEAAAEAAKALAEGRGGGGKHTTPEPFALTQPKMRLVPPPEVEIVPFKAEAVPASTYNDSTKLVDRLELDKKKDQNRKELKAKYSDPRTQPFKLRIADRPRAGEGHLQKVREEVEAAREAECNFEGVKSKPIPRQRPGQGIVRLNSAAILREDNLYRKKQESEAALLGAYERELRDSAEFDAWQKRMLHQDEEERLKLIDERRIDAALADEEAKEARIRKEHENQELAMLMKEEAKKGEVERKKADEARQSHVRQIALEVQSQREKPLIAKEDLARKHKQTARELRVEIKQAEERAAAEKRKEQARRADLIKQIRALELVPRKRETYVDPTYTPQIGLLEEMSLAELRERLAIVEEQRLEDETERRSKILSEKQEREADLAVRAQRLAEMRERAANEAAAKRAVHKAEVKKEAEERKERIADAQLKVQSAIETKRALRQQKEAELALELKRIKIKNQFLEADKEAVERKKSESQQAGEQREIIERQRRKLEEAQALLSVHKLEEQQRLLNVQREREAHEGFMREYEAHFVEVKEEAAHREAWRIADQEAKLVTRRELAHTKAMEASWSKNTLPQLATGGSAR